MLMIARPHPPLLRHLGRLAQPASAVRTTATDTSTSISSKALILSIETSCDDTCVAIVSSSGRVLAHHKHTSMFSEHGGVVPFLAKRQHARHLPALIKKALATASTSHTDLRAVAVTAGPGLGPCLGVGFRAARALCSQYHIPMVTVNHIEAHALIARLCGNLEYMEANLGYAVMSHVTEETQPSPDFSTILNLQDSHVLKPPPPPPAQVFDPSTKVPEPSLLPFPFLSLVVSGGHTTLAHFQNVGEITRLGSSRDDACGEALDKIARLLKVREAPFVHSASIYSSMSRSID